MGKDINSYGDVEEAVGQQTLRASKAAGSLNDTIWKNKHLRENTKARIYKTAIRAIITYTAEARPDISKKLKTKNCSKRQRLKYYQEKSTG